MHPSREDRDFVRSPPKGATIPRGAKFGGSIAALNRWTGKLHENRREVERAKRRAA